MSHAIQVGDLVRVSGASFMLPHTDDTVRHHIKPGAVCVVHSIGWDGSLGITGPTRHDSRPHGTNKRVGEPISQTALMGQVKLAKQAMRKRDEYAARR